MNKRKPFLCNVTRFLSDYRDIDRSQDLGAGRSDVVAALGFYKKSTLEAQNRNAGVYGFRDDESIY